MFASMMFEMPSRMKPHAMNRRGSILPRVERAAASGVSSMTAPARITRSSPESVAVKPSEFCTNWGKISTLP